MRTLLRVLGWTALGLGGLLLLLLAGAAIFTHTERFRGWARDQAVATINDAVHGTVSIGRLEGSIWGDLILRDVELQYEGQTIAQVPRLRVAYSLLGLLRGKVQLSRLEATGPSLRLEQDTDDEWNLLKALSSRQEPAEEPDTDLIVRVRSLGIEKGDIELRLNGADPQGYVLRDVNLEGSADVDGPIVTVQVPRLSARLIVPELPEFSLTGALAYRGDETADTLDLSDLVLATGVSRVKLDGNVVQRDTTELKTDVTIERLAPADVAKMMPAWPLTQDLSGTATVAGPLSALAVGLDAAAADAKITADLTIDLTQDEPHYGGTVNLHGFNVQKLLAQDNLAGVLNATLQLKGAGFALKDIAAEGRAAMRSTAVAGWSLGNVSIEGGLRDKIATMTGDLKADLGGASWRGQVVIDDKPAYDLTFSVNNLDISKTARNGDALEGNLNFAGTVKGAGIDLADLAARANLQILPSSIGPVQLERGSVALAVADQRVRITEATLRAKETTLTVRGDVALDPKQQGTLEYRARSADIAPWLALIDETGSGSLEIDGRATGNLADLRASGTVQASALTRGDIALKTGNIRFDLRRLEGQPLPQGKLQLQLIDLHAAVPLQRLDGSIGLSSQDSYEIALNVEARDQHDRLHRLAGRVDYQPELVVARLERLGLELPDGVWQLTQPATIRHHDQGLDIEDLVLRNKQQQIAVNGRFATTGKQDLRMTVEGFPLGGLSAFMEQPPDMTGTLGLQAHITGTAAAPLIDASAQLVDAAIAGQRYGGASANITYKERMAAVELTVRQDAQHSLTAAGTVPVALSWSPEWQAEPAGNMNVRVQSKGLSIAFLNAFSRDTAQKISGTVTLDLLVQGAIREPVARGSFQLSDGAVRIAPLGINVSALTVDASIDDQIVSLRQLSARARDGRLNGSGVVAMKDFWPENFKISLAATRWPAIETRRYRAVIGGNIQAEGSMKQPVVTGQLQVLNADLRPDLELLGHSTPAPRDPTIVVIRRSPAGMPIIEKDLKKEAQAQNAMWEALRLDVQVSMPNQVWIRHPDANVELGGKMRALKEPQKDVTLIGSVKAIRGWVGFQGRRFEIAQATVQFTGGEKLDPIIDVAAIYRVPQYQIEVIVKGTLDKPQLQLRSEPEMEQADILAVLLFGRPVEGLTQSQQVSLQQSAIDVATGFAATAVGTAVTEALGLDRLGLDIGEFDFGAGQIGFGRYIGDATYISIRQDLAREHARQVAIEYRIDANWKIISSTSTEGGSGIGILWHRRY